MHKRGVGLFAMDIVLQSLSFTVLLSSLAANLTSLCLRQILPHVHDLDRQRATLSKMAGNNGNDEHLVISPNIFVFQNKIQAYTPNHTHRTYVDNGRPVTSAVK